MNQITGIFFIELGFKPVSIYGGSQASRERQLIAAEQTNGPAGDNDS